MSFLNQEVLAKTLDQWFLTPQGWEVSKAFAAELLPFYDHLHGDYLLQLGCLGQNEWLKALSYRHKWILTPYNAPSHTHLQSSLEQLPFARNSMDCIVAPFMRELLHPHFIDEVDRILKPMGFIIIYGVNPWSIWGLLLKLGQLKTFLTVHRLKGLLSLKRAMNHRGYTQCQLSTFYYLPPFSNSMWLKRLDILNQLGKLIWPCPPAFYCFIAQKYQEGMTPVAKSRVEEKIEYSSSPLQPV